MYTQLYKITCKYYFKTYFNGADEARTSVLLPSITMYIKGMSYIRYTDVQRKYRQLLTSV